MTPSAAESPTRSHLRESRAAASCERMDREKRRRSLARGLRIGINAHVQIDTSALTIVRASLEIYIGRRGRGLSFATYEFVEKSDTQPAHLLPVNKANLVPRIFHEFFMMLELEKFMLCNLIVINHVPTFEYSRSRNTRVGIQYS